MGGSHKAHRTCNATTSYSINRRHKLCFHAKFVLRKLETKLPLSSYEVGSKFVRSWLEVRTKLARSLYEVGSKLGRSSFEVETKFVRSWAEVHTKWDSKFVEVGPRIVRKLTISHQEGKGSCFSVSGQSAIYRELWLHLASTNGRGLFLMLSGHPRSSFTALPKIVETLHFQVRNSLD